MKKRLLVIGHINIDHIRTATIEVEQSLGGGAVYTAFAAGVYGDTLDLLSTSCPDLPTEIFARMHASNIDTANILPILGEQRRSSMAYTSALVRTNFAHKTQAWLDATREQVPRHLPLKMHAYDMVYISPMLSHNQLLYAKWAKGQGVLTAMDVSEFYAQQNSSELLECLQYIDLFMPSDIELNEMFPSLRGDLDAIAAAVHERGVSMLVVKRSTSGSTIYDFSQHKCYHIGIRMLPNVVDATGAGDTYNGGFVSCYRHTRDAVLSARYAAVVASECIRDISFRNLIGKRREEMLKIIDGVSVEIVGS